MTKQQKKKVNMVFTYLIIFITDLQCFTPLSVVFAIFKTNEEIFGHTALLPSSFSLKNYIDGWNGTVIPYTNISEYRTSGIPHNNFHPDFLLTGCLCLCKIPFSRKEASVCCADCNFDAAKLCYHHPALYPV